MHPAIPFVAFALLLAALLFFTWKAEQARRQALGELAGRLGFAFAPDADDTHDDRYDQFSIFRRGSSRVAQNTMSGEVELFGTPCTVRCGDFRYKVTSGSGKNRRTTTYRFSYLIVHPPWDTPPLLIRPENVLDKLAGAFGFDDIDFESDEFSRRFYVKSADKRFAYDVLHPRMMEFLLAEKPPMLEIAGGALCLSDGSRRWDPPRFEQELEFVRRFCAQWPRHLVKDLGAG